MEVWHIYISAWQINRAAMSICERNILLFSPWRLVSPVSVQPASSLPAGLIWCFCGRPSNVVVINWKFVFAWRRICCDGGTLPPQPWRDLISFTGVLVVIVEMRFDRHSVHAAMKSRCYSTQTHACTQTDKQCSIIIRYQYSARCFPRIGMLLSYTDYCWRIKQWPFTILFHIQLALIMQLLYKPYSLYENLGVALMFYFA